MFIGFREAAERIRNKLKGSSKSSKPKINLEKLADKDEESDEGEYYYGKDRDVERKKKREEKFFCTNWNKF